MRSQKTIIFVVMTIMLLSACQSQLATANPTDLLDSVRTEAAQTVEALTTDVVSTAQARRTQTAIYAAPSPVPQTPKSNPAPTLSLPTDPAVPTTAVNQTSTSTGSCDEATFVEESIPDGSQFPPGMIFYKTWTLRNTGTCTWNADYDVVLTRGNPMDAPEATPLTNVPVPPGNSVTITMPFTAPLAGGGYRADFKLRNADGVIFSFEDPSQTFWVEIQVVTGRIDLISMACSIKWSNGSEELPCPGLPSDTRGFAYTDFAPILENGSKDDEYALWLGVQRIQNGILLGVSPKLLIPENAEFRTILGCASFMKSCDVTLRLSYQEDDMPVIEIAQWQKAYDGTILKITQDLSAISGKNVRIILQLEANGSSHGDTIHLLAPVIAH